jgi:hypothetical protein
MFLFFFSVFSYAGSRREAKIPPHSVAKILQVIQRYLFYF